MLPHVTDGLAAPQRLEQVEALVEPRRERGRRTALAEGEDVALRAEPRADTSRPPERRSSVAVSFASFQGRRRASGVTSAPNRTRSVASAIAVSATVVSARSCPPCGVQARWSQMKKPSQPAASDSRASWASVSTS